MSYNIIKKSLDTKLNGYQVSSLGAGNYLTLISSPPLANVKLQLNDNTAPKIPFNEGDTLEAKGVDRVYITADIVSGGQLIFGQSNSNDFKITPAPKVKDIEKIGEVSSFNATLLTSIDKIINPYTKKSVLSGESNSTSTITALNQILDCDKVKVTLSFRNLPYGTTAYSGESLLKLDSKNIGISNYAQTSGYWNFNDFTIELENVRGLSIELISRTSYSGTYFTYYIEKFDLKV